MQDCTPTGMHLYFDGMGPLILDDAQNNFVMPKTCT